MQTLTMRFFPLIDLALNQPAYQSSTLTNNTAHKAVDGNIPTCSSTQSQQDPWWRVDLGATQVVAKVMVTYKNRTEGVHVWVGECRESRNKIKLSLV